MPAKAPSRRAKRPLAERVRRLEEELAATQRRVVQLERDAADVPTMKPIPREQWIPVAPAQQMAPPAAFSPPVMPAPPPATTHDIERTLGANVLAKVGMVVLVLGVVFFLKYAIDQGWITIRARIVLGVVGGLALVGLGTWLRRWDLSRFNGYGQVLAGGGAAITYFSVFAAWQFEEYRAATGMTLELDALLLGLVAVGLAAYAIILRTQVLAMEAVALGAMAAIFGDEVTGFTVAYIVLLTVGVTASSVWRRWIYVALSALGAAYVTLVFAMVLNVPSEQVLVGAIALAGTFAATATYVRDPVPDPVGVGTILTAGSLLGTWGLTMWALDDLVDQPRAWQGATTLVLAAAAAGLAFARMAPVPARWGWGAASVVLFLAWAPIQFDGMWTTLAWTALATLGAILLSRRNHLVGRLALVVSAVLILTHLAVDEAQKIQDGELERWLGAVPFAAATAALIAAWLLAAAGGRRGDPAVRVILAAALVPPLLYSAAAFDGFVISIAWAAEAVVLLFIGFAVGQRDLRIGALAVFALVLFRVFLIDLIVLDLAVRIITFLVVGTLLLLASFLYARRQKAAPVPIPAEKPR